MRVMSKEQSEILDKLLRLAYGDALLVDRAIRASGKDDGGKSAKLEDIINYILRQRTKKRAAA